MDALTRAKPTRGYAMCELTDDLELVDIETNVKTWLGQKKIKKFVGRDKYKP